MSNTNMRSYIYKLLLSASILSATGCGSIHDGNDVAAWALAGVFAVSSIVKHVGKKKTNQVAGNGDLFPQKGYNLTKAYEHPYNVGLKECSIHRLPGSDSLCYVKLVTESVPDGNFYFMELNEKNAIILAENALSKDVGTPEERAKWFTTWLDRTGISNLGSFHRGNKYWTYYKQRKVFTRDHPEAIEDPMVRGIGVLQFNEKTAREAYQAQVSDENALVDLFLAMMLMNSMGYKSEGKYYCNGLQFSSEAAMEDYKNANGLK